MTSQLDPLMVKIQTQLLRATFIKNMAVLKERMPAIHAYYKNYTATKVQLALDANGHVNLIANDAFVYKDNPKVSSQAQVAEFLKKPAHFNFDVVRTDPDHYNYKHEKVLNGIFDKRRSDSGVNSSSKLQKGDQINFIAVMGSGLGYHLENLFAQFSIRSAYIFEPEPDCFFATLHCVDLGPMIEHCISLGGELTFKIGGSNDQYVNEINASFKRQGYFNVVKMYLYRHYLSDKTTDAFKMINEMAYRYRSGWGFCEDEVIGISHTLTNISTNKAPTFSGSVKHYKRLLPVFIIGNGPSLDSSLGYLKDNQNSAIIISSGTALKPLLDNGVIPDIHVEQERPASIYQWVKKVGHEDTLKQMDLICLNTVYPGILKLFKQAHVVLKSGDAGSTFIKEYISDNYTELSHCNPTVTNASTAIAIAMGFKNLYLFGIDYGFKSAEKHHSKDSAYSGTDFSLSGDFKVPGNFATEIFTTRIFDRSRGVLEMLLAENPDVICVNSSDGAKISHTVGSKISDLPKLKKIKEKKLAVSELLNESFDNNYYINRNLEDEFKIFLPKFKAYIEQLIAFTNSVKNRAELVNAFTMQYQFVNDSQGISSKKMFQRFFNGTLNFIQSTIMSNVYYYPEQEQQEKFIQYCLTTMNEHLEWLYKDLSENYNKPAKT